MKKLKYLFPLFIILFISESGQAQALQLSLKQAQQLAVDSSYATRDTRYNTEKKKKDVKEVLSQGLPQVNASAEYQRFLDIPVSLVPAEFFGGEAGDFAEVQFGTKHNFNAGVSASQLIFDGTYFIGLQAAKVVVELAENQEVKSEQQIKINVAQAYHTVLLSQENLQILEDNYGNLAETLEDTQALYDNGLTEEQDVDQLRLNLNQVEINIDNAESMLRIGRETLNFLIGIDLDRQVQLTDNIETLVQTNSNESYLAVQPNLNTHPDYLLAKSNYEIQNLTVRGRKAAYYPSLSAFFNHQQVAQRNEFNFTDNSKPWFPTTIVGATLSVPIWSSFRRKSQVQQAEIGLDQSLMQLKQTEENLNLEINRTRSSYANALKTWENQKESAALAERISRKTNIKYAEGVASSFELNVAESQLLTEQSKYIQAALNLLNAKQNLDNALNIY